MQINTDIHIHIAKFVGACSAGTGGTRPLGRRLGRAQPRRQPLRDLRRACRPRLRGISRGPRAPRRDRRRLRLPPLPTTSAASPSPANYPWCHGQQRYQGQIEAVARGQTSRACRRHQSVRPSPRRPWHRGRLHSPWGTENTTNGHTRNSQIKVP